MKTIQQQEIHLVPFPFSDLSRSKIRPVLVVSNNQFNKTSKDVIVCAITSKINENSQKITTGALEFGTLFKESYIKPESLFKLNKDLIIKQIGTVNKTTFNETRKRVLKLF